MARRHARIDTLALGQSGTTLTLRGALIFGTAAGALAEGQRLLEAGSLTRLDLAALTRADSAGLACVIALAAHARRAGRRLDVVHWPEGLHALAEVCDVVELLDPPTATH